MTVAARVTVISFYCLEIVRYNRRTKGPTPRLFLLLLFASGPAFIPLFSFEVLEKRPSF
jgi:hypothetical protein